LPNLISAIQGFAAGRFGAQLVAALAGILFVIPVGSYYMRDHHGLGARSEDAARDIRLRATFVETLLRQVMHAPDLLMAGVQPVGFELKHLESVAWRVFEAHEVISRLEISPEGKSGVVFMRKHELQTDSTPTRFQAAPPNTLASLQSNFVSRGLPVVSIGEGAFSIAQPIDLARGNGRSEFWGHASATVTFADLGRVLRLEEMGEQGYAVRLDYLHRNSKVLTPLFSVGDKLRDGPISHEIRLPQGDRIHLRASLPASWNAPPIAYTELVLLLVAGALVSVLTYLLLRRSVEMGEQVALRTLQLALDKESLKSEVERHRQTESKLQDSHTLLDSIFEHIPAMMVLKRASDLRVVRVNHFAETVFGQTKAALLGRSSRDLFQGHQAEQDRAADLVAVAERRLVEMPEQSIQIPGGSARWLKIKKLALIDAAGVASHILEIGEDITAHRHLDEALTENLNFVEQLLAAIPTPVFFKDAKGCYIGVNKAFEEFYGTTSGAIIGKTVHDIAPPELARIYDKADRELLESGAKQTYETRVRCADGVEKDVVVFQGGIFY